MQILFRVQWVSSLASLAFNCSYYFLEMCSLVVKELSRQSAPCRADVKENLVLILTSV